MSRRPALSLSMALVAGVSTLSASLSTVSQSSARLGGPPPAERHAPCPSDMELVLGRVCVDRYEASTLEIVDGGSLLAHSPYLPVKGLRVKAVSQKHVVPQAYISGNEADAACRESGKRLCTDDEWIMACKGPLHTQFPYGNQRKSGACVDTHRVAPLQMLFAGLGAARYRFEPMNDPRLNQIAGTVAPTGSFENCTNDFHVYDMVGNLHEWTANPRGTFRGGYYLDTHINGEGCDYRTVAHPPTYHDYSTGFRCCADPL
jgi:sulfatase modifying factor 1